MHSCTVGIDQGGAFFGIYFGQQGIDGYVYPVRIGHVLFPIRKCEFLGLDHQVDPLCFAHGVQVEIFHDVEFLQQDVAARVGRRLIDRVAFVRHGNGIRDVGAVVFHVGFCEQAPARLAERDHGFGDFPFVKRIPALRGEGSQGFAQVFLIDDVPRARGVGRHW